MMNFLTSLLSKKLGVLVAAEAIIQSLPMTADQKGLATAIVAFAYLLGQAYVDAHAPPPVVSPPPVPVPEEPKP